MSFTSPTSVGINQDPSQASDLISCLKCGATNKRFYKYCQKCVSCLKAESKTQYIHVPGVND